MDEVRQVPFIPFVEVNVVAVLDLALGNSPLIECFVHDQESHRVAQVEELRREGIVAGSDRVASHLAEGFKAPFPDALRHGTAHAAGLLMKTDAIQFDVFAVEQESSIGVEESFADADGRVVGIDHAACILHGASNCVEIRFGRRPEVRFIHVHVLNELKFRAGLDRLR